MPNTKSAERRMRNSQRKRLHNRSVKTKLRTLERNYRAAVTISQTLSDNTPAARKMCRRVRWPIEHLSRCKRIA